MKKFDAEKIFFDKQYVAHSSLLCAEMEKGIKTLPLS